MDAFHVVQYDLTMESDSERLFFTCRRMFEQWKEVLEDLWCEEEEEEHRHQVLQRVVARMINKTLCRMRETQDEYRFSGLVSPLACSTN
jgi:hypothetical protein